MNTKILPKSYKPILSVRQTEIAIKQIKDFFQINLASELRLSRITAPVFVKSGLGINDDLNGIEKPVTFSIKNMNNQQAEIVQSLAKWKRMMLADLKIKKGYGIYTDMNAIRPDEILDNIHSIYVDQWDWERVISNDERNLDFLKRIVKKIYSVLIRTEFYIYEHYHKIRPVLPEQITFINSEDLQKEYPHLSPREREDEIAKRYKAVFIIGIGNTLADGKPHDNRAPDYDDWTTPTFEDYKGLNGDIIVWNPILKTAYEISSMGIRVDRKSLLRQLELTNTLERKELLWHKRLLNNEFPLSIGGGIGQSRLCMFYLRKVHIGETQASIWPDEVIVECNKNNIPLL
ncbi:MAG: aspartate--ammonia ligase [Ignavibacteria bacterium RBG_13_36_8]|nr:MAG: aspartate--ammonia ligase [Ignavibacteria bacterium RBG_13_36_8]